MQFDEVNAMKRLMKCSQVIPGLGDDDDAVSRAKQSRGEKKARKMFAKLGLKQVRNN